MQRLCAFCERGRCFVLCDGCFLLGVGLRHGKSKKIGYTMERLMAAGELKFEYIGHYFLEGTEGKLPFYRVTKE